MTTTKSTRPAARLTGGAWAIDTTGRMSTTKFTATSRGTKTSQAPKENGVDSPHRLRIAFLATSDAPAPITSTPPRPSSSRPTACAHRTASPLHDQKETVSMQHTPSQSLRTIETRTSHRRKWRDTSAGIRGKAKKGDFTQHDVSKPLDIDHDQYHGRTLRKGPRIDEGQRTAHRVTGKDKGKVVWISRDDIVRSQASPKRRRHSPHRLRIAFLATSDAPAPITSTPPRPSSSRPTACAHRTASPLHDQKETVSMQHTPSQSLRTIETRTSHRRKWRDTSAGIRGKAKKGDFTQHDVSKPLDIDHDQYHGRTLRKGPRIDEGQRTAHRVTGKDKGKVVWISRDDIVRSQASPKRRRRMLRQHLKIKPSRRNSMKHTTVDSLAAQSSPIWTSCRAEFNTPFQSPIDLNGYQENSSPFIHRTGPETQLYSYSHYRRYLHHDGNTFPAVHGLGTISSPPNQDHAESRGSISFIELIDSISFPGKGEGNGRRSWNPRLPSYRHHPHLDHASQSAQMADAPGPKKHRGIRGRLKEFKEFLKRSGSQTPRSESPSLVRNVEGSGGPTARNQPEQGAELSSLRGRSAQDSLDVASNAVSPPQLTSDGPQEETEQPIEDPRDDNVPDMVVPALSPEADNSVPSKGIGSKIYGGVKATLRLVAEVGDVFPPVKSTAAGLLFIFDLIDAYGENHEAFDKLLERVKVLSAILASCPKDVTEEVLDRFRGLSLFMCTVQEKDLQDVYLIIPTVAKILAEERPDFGKALEQVLLNDPSCRSPKTMSLNDQYSKLILEPAAKVFTPDDLLVVCIDALDECKDGDSIAQLVTTLSRKPTVPLKFFLTSRPEIALRTSLQSSGKQLRLYDIEEHVVKADVMLFLTEQFRAVPAIYEAHKDTWPPPEIEAIADFSGKLFIVAFTAFKYITAPNGVCLERFRHFAQRSSVLGVRGVEALYDGIMLEAFKGLELDEQDLVHSCLSLLVVAQKPLSAYDYGRLLNKDTALIREAFKALHSVVKVPEEGAHDGSISIYHASFVDYVTSHTPREQKWVVEKPVAHAATCDACFRIMESMLCFGISGARTSYLSNDDQPTPLKLGSELAYACSAWGDHAIHAGLKSEMRQQKVEVFLKAEIVWYWLEALSAVKAEATSAELQTLSDGLGDFIHTFETAISHSAPHLYLSAIPFSSALSTEAQISIPTLESVPIVHHCPNAGREILSINLGANRGCDCLVFSPDGKYIAAAIYFQTLGQAAVGPMTGHTDEVHAVALSPDGRFVVSSSDNKTIQIWDAQTGEAASERFEGHTAAVVSVAYSPDGKCIATGSATVPTSGLSPPDGKFLASGSEDGTVRVWDAQTGDLSFPPIRMDNTPVYSLAYSPDGEYFACGLDDGAVCLWHAQTGKPTSNAMSGHTGVVWSMAFSPDGSTIASASQDKTVRLWDGRTGEPRGEPLTGHTNEVFVVAWSPDGKYLVSGGDDNTVRVWDLTGAQRVFEPMAGHTDVVLSVAYSPDGRHIASGSGDKTIRLWDAETRQPIGKPIAGHTEAVRSVRYSPDRSCISSGSNDGTIRLWDAQTGEPLSSPIIGHGAPVTSVAFSPTGDRIASGSRDTTVRIWKLP
ncbi:hypothetical protein DFP72DRAFT_1066748 [Ephemerocybe angulata]|uniref:Nephrocystin 3-like N-terminal domain-containing protein n=1 Tax=Ephemerocybe angulata TaxID=980116 RepID=A0A8H6M810_9AGAR|nr:hypothetical protein DFP72DRAFT_1066748 [Tulosesus angulatus]